MFHMRGEKFNSLLVLSRKLCYPLEYNDSRLHNESPWAHRTLIARSLKGLHDTLSVSVVHPTWQLTRPELDQHKGWVFRSPNDAPVIPLTGFGSIPCTGCVPDPLNDAKSVRDIYDLSNDV